MPVDVSVQNEINRDGRYLQPKLAYAKSKKLEVHEKINNFEYKYYIPEEELEKSGRVMEFFMNPTNTKDKKFIVRDKTGKEFAKDVKLELDYIYLIGFSQDGHRIKGCKAEVPRLFTSDGEKRVVYEKYAFIRSGEDLIFLKESYRTNRYEIIFNPPVLLLYAINTWHLQRVDEITEERANLILGKKINELRAEYSYNPILEPKKGYPWWATLEDLDKEFEERGIAVLEGQDSPYDRPMLVRSKKVRRAKTEQQKLEEAKKTMRESQEKKYRDEMLIMLHNDEIQRKYGGLLD